MAILAMPLHGRDAGGASGETLDKKLSSNDIFTGFKEITFTLARRQIDRIFSMLASSWISNRARSPVRTIEKTSDFNSSKTPDGGLSRVSSVSEAPKLKIWRSSPQP